MRKTKIICTIGPASESEEKLRELMLAGMNVARFNFSHGSHKEQLVKYNRVLIVRKELGLPVATLLDTKGPEIRLRDFEGGKVELVSGQQFILTTEEIMGTAQKATISYKNLKNDIKVGTTILIDDGLIEMTVEEIKGEDIVCKIILVTEQHTDSGNSELRRARHIIASVSDHNGAAGFKGRPSFRRSQRSANIRNAVQNVFNDLPFFRACLIKRVACNKVKIFQQIKVLQYLNRKLLRFACCKYYPAARRAKLRKQLCNARINLVFEFSAVGKPVAIIVECKFCLFIVKAVICFERIHKRRPDKAEELRSVRNTDAEFFQCIHHRVCDAERRIGQRAVKIE